jgi:hypothetical protein
VPSRSSRSSELNFNRIMRNTIQLSFSEKMDSIEINVKNVITFSGIKIKTRKSVEIVIVLGLMDLLEERIRTIRDILLVKFGIILKKLLLHREFLVRR